MARTLAKEDIAVRGGPRNGLRMLARVMDDGTVKIEGAAIFFPDGLDDYWFDQDAMELVYTPTTGGN